MEVQNPNSVSNNLGVEGEPRSFSPLPEPKESKKSLVVIIILIFLLLVVSSIAVYYFLKNQNLEQEDTINFAEVGFRETEVDFSQELVFEEMEEIEEEPVIIFDEEVVVITPEELLKIEKVVNPEYDSSITFEVENTVGRYALVNKGTVGGLIGETGVLKKVGGEWIIKSSFLHNWFERSCDELCEAGVPLELISDSPGISRSFEFCGDFGDIPYDEYCRN